MNNMKIIKNWKSFNEAVEVTEVQAEVKKDIAKAPKREKNAYQLYFAKVLKDQFGATKLGALDKEKRGEFFKYIKSNWQKEKAKMLKKVDDKEEKK